MKIWRIMDWNGSNGKTSEPIVTQSREKLKEKKKMRIDKKKIKKIRSPGTKEPKTLKWRDCYEVRPDSIRKKP